MVEKEKTVKELSDELDALASFPEDFETSNSSNSNSDVPSKTNKPVDGQPLENVVMVIPSKKKIEDKPVLRVAKISEAKPVSPPITEPVSVPMQSQPLPSSTISAQPQVPINEPLPVEVQPKPSVASGRPSLDDIINRGLEKKKQQIFEKAKVDYENTENRFYDNLFAMIDSAANYSGPLQPVPTPPFPPMQQPSIPTPTIIKEVVKDNSEAIKLLDFEIAKIQDVIIRSPKGTNLEPLKFIEQSFKKQKATLQGIPYTEAPVTLPQTNSNSATATKPALSKRQYSFWKVGVPLIAVAMLGTLGVLYAVFAGLL